MVLFYPTVPHICTSELLYISCWEATIKITERSHHLYPLGSFRWKYKSWNVRPLHLLIRILLFLKNLTCFRFQSSDLVKTVFFCVCCFFSGLLRVRLFFFWSKFIFPVQSFSVSHWALSRRFWSGCKLMINVINMTHRSVLDNGSAKWNQ